MNFRILSISGRDSKEMLLIQMVNVKLRHRIMHLLCLRKAYRLSLILPKMRAKVQILPLDILRRFFAHPLALLRQQLRVT
jgi:hypothetical protein